MIKQNQSENTIFAAAYVKRKRITYSIFQKFSAVIMILTLLWLTISTPFVFASQQEIAKHKMEHKSSPLTNNEEDNCKPPGNNTEEKVPNNTNLSEEYIHDHNITHPYFISAASQYHKCENADTYIAFHGELLVPPPNAA